MQPKYVAFLARALKCHGKHVIQRDIKPGNLLIGAQSIWIPCLGELKIADFGRVPLLSTCPNLFTLFPTHTIVQVDLKFSPKLIVSSSAKDLISQMLVKDSSQRLPLYKLLDHPWIVQNADPSSIYKA
ncbi:hypothetical protein PVK06_017961 [Gossypium arboreum]|uniref:Protein kinase domain-containing protein n=1 Tax=Gossypium arboreum TaxID=29729 RepID=A0ABR0Q461_GOSAR|nr:hypothetical protein PVK06_017961 [Gossypium arboreum]